jgi:hypothetical protein
VDFEALEAADLGEFVKRNDRCSRIWVARNAAGIVVGSIAIDRSHQPDEAHLRWFWSTPEPAALASGADSCTMP